MPSVIIKRGIFIMKFGLLGAVNVENTVEAKYKYIEKLMELRNSMDILCFPEMFFISDYKEISYDIIKKLESIRLLIKAKVIEWDLAVSYGTVVCENNDFYITQIIALPDGREYEYRKMILGKNERKHFKSGEEICFFDYKGIRFGILLCIETHLPELSYLYKRKGCQIILAPFKMPGTVEKRIEIWKKYIPARSYDYNLIHICNNYYGGVYATDGKGDNIDIKNDGNINYLDIDFKDAFNNRVEYFDYSRNDLIEKYIDEFRTGDKDDTRKE